MFIYLSKVVPALLLYPPGLTILLLLVAASLRKRMPRFAVGSFIFAVVSLYALSTHAVAEELQRSLESTYPEVSISSVPTADVIVVLGGYLRTPSRQHPTPDLTEESDRLRAAARLFQANKAPLVLLSGGNLAPTAATASSPSTPNWTSRARTCLPASGACSRWWVAKLPSITDASRSHYRPVWKSPPKP